MQGRATSILATLGIMVLGFLAFPALLRAATSDTTAGEPTGELRISFAFLGSQRFIPWTEPGSGGVKQYQMLVGCPSETDTSSVRLYAAILTGVSSFR